MKSNSLLVSLIVILPFSFFSHSDTSAESAELDFGFFQREVQPIFLAKRSGNMRCVDCHAGKSYSAFNLQPLTVDHFYWTEEESQKNYHAASSMVVAGENPLASRLLTHPLARSAGGDPFHGGGKHFQTVSDPEWQILKAWVAGATKRQKITRTVARIIQTNAASDISHVIDPESNEVVAVISDVQIPHGVVGAPGADAIYISNEKLHTLDVVDSRTYRVVRRIQLSGKPNNVAVSNDGLKVYVGIMEMPGAVDIIDTRSFKKVKTVPVSGAIHNVYITPDGRHAVAGSIHTSTINVIDTVNDELSWTLKLDAGIRPMTFDVNKDGSTRNIYVQLSSFHGFAVIDFKQQKEIARIKHTELPDVHAHGDGLQGAPAHGLGVSPDGKTLWSTSKIYGYAYVYSLPDLNEIAAVAVGQHPEWITFSPDGSSAYIGVAGDNATCVVDTKSLQVIARIPVGQVPKRVATVMVPQ